MVPKPPKAGSCAIQLSKCYGREYASSQGRDCPRVKTVNVISGSDKGYHSSNMLAVLSLYRRTYS